MEHFPEDLFRPSCEVVLLRLQVPTWVLGYLFGTTSVDYFRGPQRAKMSPRLRPIEAAMRNERPIKLMFGESHTYPIECHPRMLYQSHAKGYLEAQCPKTGELRTYLLSKVRKAIPL